MKRRMRKMEMNLAQAQPCLLLKSRLPQDMAGLMVVSRNQHANSQAKELIQNRTFSQQRYLAILHSQPTSNNRNGNGLQRTRDKNRDDIKPRNTTIGSSELRAATSPGGTLLDRKRSGNFAVLRLPLQLDP
ncbi:unnamed protein product, partial [Amoebophrya sp. A25]|eukprot:GSA25T00010025001.1